MGDVNMSKMSQISENKLTEKLLKISSISDTDITNDHTTESKDSDDPGDDLTPSNGTEFTKILENEAKEALEALEKDPRAIEEEIIRARQAQKRINDATAKKHVKAANYTGTPKPLNETSDKTSDQVNGESKASQLTQNVDENGGKENTGNESDSSDEISEVDVDEAEEAKLALDEKAKKEREFMPPPVKVIERPGAVFDPNICGVFGFVISALQIYALREADEEFKENGLDLVLSLSTTTYILASTWTFTSNLEGWTTFPYITATFLVAGAAAPVTGYYLGIDPWAYGTESALLYLMFIWGPFIYIVLSTLFAVANEINERQHGFGVDL